MHATDAGLLHREPREVTRRASGRTGHRFTDAIGARLIPAAGFFARALRATHRVTNLL